MGPSRVFFLTGAALLALVSTAAQAVAQETLRPKDIRSIAKQGSSALPRLQDLLRNPDLDIRIDDHPDPLAELRRLHAVSQERFAVFRRFLPGTDSPCGVFDRAVIDAAVARDGKPPT